MAEIWQFNLGYRLFRFYTDWCTRSSFLRIRTEGRSNIPSDTPIILAPNHCCTMMDAALILCTGGSATAFGARADIFSTSLASFFRWLKIVPLARQRDGLKDVAKNYAVFDEVADCIGHDVPFCIYVEGTHRAMRGLQPVKKGVFRIARRAQELGGKPVAIVPVGIAYESFFRLMTEVVVRFGEPIYVDQHPDKNLTDVLGERILSLIEDYPRRPGIPLYLSIPLAVVSVPFFLLGAVMSSPILLLSYILGTRLKDRAWINTIRLLVKVILLPFILAGVGIPAFMHLPWWAACAVLVCFAYAPSLFYLTNNIFINIRKDIRELKK